MNLDPSLCCICGEDALNTSQRVPCAICRKITHVKCSQEDLTDDEISRLNDPLEQIKFICFHCEQVMKQHVIGIQCQDDHNCRHDPNSIISVEEHNMADFNGNQNTEQKITFTQKKLIFHNHTKTRIHRISRSNRENKEKALCAYSSKLSYGQRPPFNLEPNRTNWKYRRKSK